MAKEELDKFFSVRLDEYKGKMLKALKDYEKRGASNLFERLLEEACEKRGIKIPTPKKTK